MTNSYSPASGTSSSARSAWSRTRSSTGVSNGSPGYSTSRENRTAPVARSARPVRSKLTGAASGCPAAASRWLRKTGTAMAARIKTARNDPTTMPTIAQADRPRRGGGPPTGPKDDAVYGGSAPYGGGAPTTRGSPAPYGAGAGEPAGSPHGPTYGPVYGSGGVSSCAGSGIHPVLIVGSSLTPVLIDSQRADLKRPSEIRPSGDPVTVGTLWEDPPVQDEILLGEGVVIDARPASFATRMLGAVLDVLVLGTVFYVLVIIVGVAGGSADPAAGAALVIATTVTVFVIIPATVETLTGGRSVGKLAAGIRIVRDDGGPIRARHAIIRALTGVLELWITVGSVALITSLAHPKGKRLGDLLAGTYAVRVRERGDQSNRAHRQPELEDAGEGPDDRVAGSDRSAVVPDDPDTR